MFSSVLEYCYLSFLTTRGGLGMTTTKRHASIAAMLLLVSVVASACTVDDVLNIVNLLKLLGIL